MPERRSDRRLWSVWWWWWCSGRSEMWSERRRAPNVAIDMAQHSMHPVQRHLWDSIYPNAQPNPPRIPLCARAPKVHVCNLSSSWNADLLQFMEKRRGKANCDYARSPCVETTHSGTGKMTDYSLLRQYAAEVPILAKLLMMPHAAPPNEADLFVVPWFASTELYADSNHWNRNNRRANAKVHELLPLLTHFYGSYRSRHLFLATRDAEYVIPTLRALVNESGAMLLHYGPTSPNIRGEITVPANAAGFGAPLLPPPPIRYNLFSMMNPKINKRRQRIGEELLRLNRSVPIQYHPFGNHHHMSSLSPQAAFAMMRETAVCPIAQGDLPYQHRLYDVLVAGCVPLFFRCNASDGLPEGVRRPGLSLRARSDRHTRGADGCPPLSSALAADQGHACETWSWDPRTRSSWWHGGKAENAHACVHSALPFPSTVPWRDISVRLDASLLRATRPGQLAAAIRPLIHDQGSSGVKVSEEVRCARERLRSVRRYFVYDWSGTTFDAFSALMVEICSKLSDESIG